MKKEVNEIKATLPEEKAINFERYLGELLKWNRTYNLTALTDPVEIYEKHFGDSSSPLEFIKDGSKLVDLGTGAGFPGIPIKILRDNVRVTLIEATAKKTNFCEHVIRELELKDIKVVKGRAEDPAVQKKSGKFDIVISRATLKLPAFLRIGSVYLKKEGNLIAMLGPKWSDDLDNSLDEMKTSDLKLIKVHEYTLPITQNKRALLLFQKKNKL